MLKVLVISAGLLMASAGQASAPPSPRGGRKPSPPTETPAAAPAAPAETTPPPLTPSPPAVAPPTEAPATAPPAATASATAPPAKKAHKPKPRNKAEREQLLESAGVERSSVGIDANAASAPIPPSLSSPALRQEMATGRGPTGTASEREKMESLSADLARARTALQAETARLEALLKKPVGGGQAGEAPAGDGSMPVGDPMAATRPAAPPAPANQVEIVSKALKGMKPEQAAAIIGHLNRGLAADVLQKMRPADAGVILGFLKPELGAALATEIANREPPKAKPGDKAKP
jgi:flagellar motility protein MotE (MotC chaperone)